MMKHFTVSLAMAALAGASALPLNAEEARATAPAPIVNAGTASAGGAGEAQGPVAAPAQGKTTQPAAPVSATAAPAAVAVDAPKPRPQPSLKVAINLSAQTMTVHENGVLRYVWPISSGRAGYRTPTGTFRGQWMSRMHYSRKYDNAPMPHSVFFHNGYAIHATYATGMLGRPASHGCIRLSPGNAKTFYGMVGKHGLGQTRIAINGVARDSSPAVAQPRTYRPKTYAAHGDYGYNAARVKPPKVAGAKVAKQKPGYAFGYAPAPKYAPASAGKYTWPGDAPRVTRQRTSAAGYGTYR